MSIHRTTLISGLITDEPKPDIRTDYAAYQAWSNRSLKILILRGHWQPDAAARRGRRSGMIGEITIEHLVSDLSGKGRGGIDARFLAPGDGAIVRQEISVEQHETYAAADAADIHELT